MLTAIQLSPTAIVYFGSEDHNVYALNAATGAFIWNYPTGNKIMLSSPAVSNGIVYIGSEDDKIYALNASNGALHMELCDRQPSRFFTSLKRGRSLRGFR